jgi:UDP-N-acetylmuramoylalanine--D-glutamate ligase
VRLYRSPGDIAGMRVLIMGLGTKDGGVGAALYAHGKGGVITVTDCRPESALVEPLAELRGLGIRFRLGCHLEADFEAADLVVRNPGIRRSNEYLQIASQNGAAVDSPIGIFCETVGRPWIGITGTKGKSYTTHLTSHLLSLSGIASVAAGNNCVSPLRTVDDRSLLHVLELSSWQLAEMGLHGKSPHIGCWINFFPDHMNWYGSMEEYRRDKEMIFRCQEENDFMIVPRDDKSLSSLPGCARKLRFSASDEGEGETGCFLEKGVIVYREGPATLPVIDTDELPWELKAPIHLDLIPPSVCCAVAAGADPSSLGDALRSFTGIPYRFSTIYERGEVRIVNDSAATTPDSVIAALKSLRPGLTVLIAGGGGHKNLEYRALADSVLDIVDLLILFRGDAASDLIESELKGRFGGRIRRVDDMNEAVSAGIAPLLEGGTGTLLLSPGCSGAPFYVDLFERGRLFDEAVGKALSLHRSEEEGAAK